MGGGIFLGLREAMSGGLWWRREKDAAAAHVGGKEAPLGTREKETALGRPVLLRTPPFFLHTHNTHPGSGQLCKWDLCFAAVSGLGCSRGVFLRGSYRLFV